MEMTNRSIHTISPSATGLWMGVGRRRAELEAQRASWRNKYGPMVIVQSFLSFTVFLFAFGPWNWPVTNPFQLYIFLFSAQAALFLGYWRAVNFNVEGVVYTGRFSTKQILHISVVLNLIAAYPYLYLWVGRDAKSVGGLVSHILRAAQDPLWAYTDKFEQATSQSNILLYFYMMLSPILWVAIPLALRYWVELRRWMKIAIVLIFITNGLAWVAQGTMKGIADLAATVACSVAASRVAAGPRIKRQTRFSKVQRTATIAAACAGAILFFAYVQNGRSSGEINAYDRNASIALDTSNWMMVGLPKGGQHAVSASVSYLSQGYYGTSLALREPFTWSYGLGHSAAFTSIFRKLTGFDATELTYMAHEERYGWDMQLRWNSIYPWLASDFTFPGTLVVLFMIGWLLGATWSDVRTSQGPFALPLFVLIMIMIFYFPANDQILSSSMSVLAFWGLVLMWATSRSTMRRRTWR